MRSVIKLDTGWTFHSSFSPALVHTFTPGDTVRLPHNALDLPLTLRRLRIRRSAGSYLADIVIGVSATDHISQGHALADAVEEACDPEAPSDSSLTAFFAILAEHPDLARVFLVETDHHDPEMRSVGRAMLERLAGLMAPAAPHPLARAGAMGAILRLARFWIEGGYREPVSEMAALARRFVEAAGQEPQ